MDRLVVFLHERLPNVEQVDLAPGDQDPGEGLLIRAGTLVEPREGDTAGEETGTSARTTGRLSAVSLPAQKPDWGIMSLSSTGSADPDASGPSTGQTGRNGLYELTRKAAKFMSTWNRAM